MVVLGLAMAIIMDQAGMPQKWHAAIVGTLVSFGGVSLVFQRKWSYPQFWIALAICFAVHLAATWVVFEKVLAHVKVIGILIWTPIAFAEGILLLGVIPVLERKLRREKR